MNKNQNTMNGISTATDTVVRELQRRILSGELLPGTQLKNTQLAEEFGTSITPVREALARLEKLGLAEYRPRCGWTVNRLDDQGMREVYEMRRLLEGYAAKVICASDQDTDLSALESCCDRYDAALRAGENALCVDLDIQFHYELVCLSGNRYAIEMMDRLRNLIRVCRTVEFSDTNGWASSADHRRMVECLKRRDLAGVEERLDSHVRPCSLD